MTTTPIIQVQDLTMAFGETVVQHDLTFNVSPGTVFAIIGPSGCGKSTLLRHLIGLLEPTAGHIDILGTDLNAADEVEGNQLLQRLGVLFQGAALWSSMTVAENVALPMELHTELSRAQIEDQVAFRLALVGLAGAADQYPSALSGGMKKRAGLARALALDPPILMLDEPSAGLDPLTARALDELILQLRDTLGVTVVLVTHELDSLFRIADEILFLDPESGTAIAQGSPSQLQQHCEHALVREFLAPATGRTRGSS